MGRACMWLMGLWILLGDALRTSDRGSRLMAAVLLAIVALVVALLLWP